MPADFSALSPSEFEALSADLIGRALGIRFEQFGEGADGGIDGRHAPEAQSLTLLQAKRYERSAISALKREGAREDRSVGARSLHPVNVCSDDPTTEAGPRGDLRPRHSISGKHLRARGS